MKSLYDLSDKEIALVLIGGGLFIAIVLILGLCCLFYSANRGGRRKSQASTQSKNGILFKEQSQSVVRGEHPMAFVLPTVSMSEPCSEFSDVDSLNTFSTSPSISATSLSRSHAPPWRRVRGISAHQTLHHTSGYGSRYSSRRSRRRKYQRLYSDRGSEPEDSFGLRQWPSGRGPPLSPSSGLSLATSPVPNPFLSTSPRSDFELGSVRRKVPSSAHSKSATTSPRSMDEHSFYSQGWETSEVSGHLSDDEDLSHFDQHHLRTFLEEGHVEEESLGTIKVSFAVNSSNRIVITEIFISNLQRTAKCQLERIAIRIKTYPECQTSFETGLLSVFEDKILLLDAIELPVTNAEIRVPFVLKLTILDKSFLKPHQPTTTSSAERPDQSSSSLGAFAKIERQFTRRPPQAYAHALINLKKILPLRDSGSFAEADLQPSVSAHLAEIFSDSVELSLCYETAIGKLTLSIIQAQLTGVTTWHQDSEAFLYAKVTLFEGRRVIKAKKTRPVGFSESPQFHETFSILFPESYLDRVSCVISLCSKNKQGSKLVLGRFSIGPASFAEGRGLRHWSRMIQNSGATIIQWHHLN